MKKLLLILPTQSLIYLSVFGVGIFVFVFFIILPTQKTSAQLDKDILNLRSRIEKQKILRPVFDGLLEQAKKKSKADLPDAPKTKLDRSQINRLSKNLKAMASRHGLEIQSMNTALSNLLDQGGYLQLSLKLTGTISSFRTYLVALGAIPSLEVIEDIHMRAIAGTREFKIKMWLALK